MEKVRPWCGQPSDRGRLKNRTEADHRQLTVYKHVLALNRSVAGRRVQTALTDTGPHTGPWLNITLN